MAGGRSIWDYIKNYKFNSVFTKNFLMILLLIELPLVGICIGVYGYYGSILREEVGAAHKSALSKVRDMVDMIAREVDRLSVRIASDKGVAEFLSSPKGVFPDYNTISVLQNVTSTISISAGDYINSIYIYSDLNDYVLSSTRGGTALSRFYDRDWIKEYEAKKLLMVHWISPRKVAGVFNKNQFQFFITRFYMAPLDDPGKKGVVIINLDIEALKQLISNASQNRIEKIFIADGNGTILFCHDTSLIGKSVRMVPGLKDMVFEDHSTSHIKDVNGTRQVVTYVHSGFNDWKYISVIPLSIYEQKISYLRKFMWVSIVFSIIIAVIVAFFISVRVFMPIKDIMVMLEDPEGYFESRNALDGTGRLNEFKFIATNILKSFDENKHMEEELTRRMAMLKEAQTAALQSQISPHFLYNTLQTINWLVMGLTKGENEASSVITALSQILRIAMETETHLIPVRDEIHHAQLYIDIQKIRYKNKFEAIWEVDDKTMDCMISKITLQPLIENAIYHGIKPKKEKGLITIKGFIEGDNIAFEIEDNGVGMPEQHIESLNRELSRDYIQGDQHIGIKNVNQRIKLIFGEKYGVVVRSNTNNGITVKVMIPNVK